MDDVLVFILGLAFSWIGAAIIGYFAAGVRLGEVLSELQFVKSNIMTEKSGLGVQAKKQYAEAEEAMYADFIPILLEKAPVLLDPNAKPEDKQAIIDGLKLKAVEHAGTIARVAKRYSKKL